jgi:hypothetical protein
MTLSTAWAGAEVVVEAAPAASLGAASEVPLELTPVAAAAGNTDSKMASTINR